MIEVEDWPSELHHFFLSVYVLGECLWLVGISACFLAELIRLVLCQGKSKCEIYSFRLISSKKLTVSRNSEPCRIVILYICYSSSWDNTQQQTRHFRLWMWKSCRWDSRVLHPRHDNKRSWGRGHMLVTALHLEQMFVFCFSRQKNSACVRPISPVVGGRIKIFILFLTWSNQAKKPLMSRCKYFAYKITTCVRMPLNVFTNNKLWRINRKRWDGTTAARSVANN